MAVPLLLWMFLQLLALLAGRFAVHATLIIQFAAGGMFFAYLLRDFRRAGSMILTAGVMLALAAHQSGVAVSTCILPWIVIAIWLTLLALAAKIPRSFHATIVALANLLTLGGLVLWYVAMDFGKQAAIAQFSPLVLTLQMLG